MVYRNKNLIFTIFVVVLSGFKNFKNNQKITIISFLSSFK